LLDEQGCLHFLGRDKDMIKVNGMSVFPSEVEAILARHPEVLDSAVVAAPDETRGQVPVAFVRRTDGSELSADGLRAWCRQNMAVYKVPLVELVEAFPLTATGKIRKVDLTVPAAAVATRRA
jgi:long-chain acyl-CoA synthetase